MVVRNSWSMVACVCLVGALGCRKHSDPGSTTLPVITGFTPAQAAVNDTITVNGSGFDGTTNVSIGGAWATFTHINDTQLTVVVPVTAMTGIIGVINGLGSGGSTNQIFYVTPQVYSIVPTTGGPGTVVTLTGYGLTGAENVLFAPVAAAGQQQTGYATTFLVNSANQIQATVPLGALTGPITITVPGPPATGSTLQTTLTAPSPAFTFSLGTFTKPVFTSFAPAQALTGQTITITGTGMSSVSGVTIGGVASYFTLVNDTTLTVPIPAAAVSGSIALSSVLLPPPGVVSSPNPFTVTPTITNFSPAKGPAGTLVTFTGTGFVGTTSIAFGNATLSNFVVTSANTAQANVAEGSASGAITLVSNGVTCKSLTNFTYLADATSAPLITSATISTPTLPAGATTPGPDQVIAGASQVTLGGSGFLGVTDATLGGASATPTVNSDTQLVFTVPDDAISGFIGVTNDLGAFAYAGPAPFAGFTVMPVISAILPASATAGSTIKVSGSGFNGASSVTINGVQVNFVVSSPNLITVQVPAGLPKTSVPVTVTASGLTATNGINSTFTGQ